MDDGLRAYRKQRPSMGLRAQTDTKWAFAPRQPWLVPNPSAPREFIFGIGRDTINQTLATQRQTSICISPNKVLADPCHGLASTNAWVNVCSGQQETQQNRPAASARKRRPPWRHKRRSSRTSSAHFYQPQINMKRSPRRVAATETHSRREVAPMARLGREEG